MAYLFAFGPGWFVVGKLGMVQAAVWLLWRLRKHRLARAAAMPLNVVYGALAAYHGWFAARELALSATGTSWGTAWQTLPLF